MMYEQLKSQVNPDLVKAVETAQRKLALLGKRKADAESRLVSLAEQKIKLTSLKDASIAESESAFDKFAVNLRKINDEIEARAEAVKTLSASIIPEAEKAVTEAQRQLRNSIRALCAKQAEAITGQMNGLLAQLVSLSDEQYTATERIYLDYRMITGPYDTGIYASPYNDRVNFQVVPATYSQRGTMKASTAPVEPPPAEPPEPVPLEIVNPGEGEGANSPESEAV